MPTVYKKLRRIRDSSIFPNPDRLTTQFWSFFIGASSAWAAIGLALVWWRLPTFPYDTISAVSMGAALAFLILPVFLNFGLHELSHWLMMKYYADYDHVFFMSTGAAMVSNFAAIIWVGMLILLEIFGFDIAAAIQGVLSGVIDISASNIRLITILGISLSPGAVFFLGRNGIKRYTDEATVIGPFTNFIVGIVLFGYFGWQLPAIAFDAFWEGTLALTMYFAFLIAIINAIPMPGTDGYHVMKARDFETTALNLVIIILSVAILMGAL